MSVKSRVSTTANSVVGNTKMVLNEETISARTDFPAIGSSLPIFETNLRLVSKKSWGEKKEKKRCFPSVTATCSEKKDKSVCRSSE